jgi:cyclohexa-1,5-dienecarbonyl-CoA hydratase
MTTREHDDERTAKSDAMGEPRFVGFWERYDVARLTLARPPLNILTIDMMREINDALERAAAKPSLKVLVIASEGKAFSAGVAVEDDSGGWAKRMLETFHRTVYTLRALDCVTLAVVQGAALGRGAELATLCDRVIASQTATFGQPEVKMGVFAPIAALHYPSRVGLAQTYRLLLSGEVISAEEARRIGLADTVVAADRLDETVDAEVERLTAQSAPILRLTKHAIRDSLGVPFDLALAKLEELYQYELLPIEDAVEGLRAFVEKRKPIWRDR